MRKYFWFSFRGRHFSLIINRVGGFIFQYKIPNFLRGDGIPYRTGFYIVKPCRITGGADVPVWKIFERQYVPTL